MIWQDYIISIVGFSFGIMLIPMVRDSLVGRTVNIYSAGLTTLGLYVISCCFFTLDLWISTISNLFSGSVWFILFILAYKQQRYKSNKKVLV